MSDYELEWHRQPLRPLTAYRDELLGRLNSLQLNSRERGPLIVRIRDVEDQIDRIGKAAQE